MLGRLRYAIGVKKCMVEIGLNPVTLHPEYRKSVQDFAYLNRNTPEECAAAILYRLAISHRPDGYQLVLTDWLDRGLVRQRALRSAAQRFDGAADPGRPSDRPIVKRHRTAHPA